MDDKRQIMLDALVEVIGDRYRDSVAFAVVYGSYATGQATPKSDVDVVFVGKDERATELQRTFIFEGIGYDFWCMPEERFQRIVDEFQPLVSIFAEGKLIWADSPEREARFAELQQRLRTADRNTRPTEFAREVGRLLSQMKALTFDHAVADGPEQRHIQGKLVLLAGDLLARVNRTYFRFGIKRYLEEISSFELQPKSVAHDLALLTRENVATETLVAFVLSMRDFWTGVLRQHGEPLRDDDLRGFYEEAISTWNKIDQAASSGDLPLTFLAAVGLENELAGFRANGISLRSTFEGSPTRAMDIRLNAEINRREFVETLRQRGIPIVELSTIEDVVQHIRGGA